MGDMESEQSHSDFEVEISNLDEPKTTSSSPRPSLRSRKPRFSPRQRRRYLILLNGLMILAVVLLLATTTPVRELVGSVLFPPAPSPTATLVPGVDLFYVDASPPWGRLLVDGHPTRLPAIGSNPPLRFARGQHQLVWQADPFLAQRCSISVPSAFTDTCNERGIAQVNPGLSAWVISFSESLANLAGTSRTALLRAAQAALDARQSTDTVRPGEHYVLATDNPACSTRGAQGYQCYATASQPLRATLNFQLDMNKASDKMCIDPQPGDCTWNNQDCRQFCGGTFLSSSPQEWDVLAPVTSLWTFATMDGQVLTRDVPDDSAYDYATGQTLDESLAQLRITWDSPGWHVALGARTLTIQGVGSQGAAFFDPACAAMTQQLGNMNPPEGANGEPQYLQFQFQWQFTSGMLLAAGCVAVGTLQPGDGLTTPTPGHGQPPTFDYLHRFGVLLALNSPAQRFGLLLPVADPYEQQLARELMKG